MPRLKDEDEEEDDELPSGLLPSSRIAHTARKQQLKDEEDGEDAVELPQRRASCSTPTFPQISEADCPLLKLDLRAEHGRPVFSRG